MPGLLSQFVAACLIASCLVKVSASLEQEKQCEYHVLEMYQRLTLRSIRYQLRT